MPFPTFVQNMIWFFHKTAGSTPISVNRKTWTYLKLLGFGLRSKNFWSIWVYFNFCRVQNEQSSEWAEFRMSSVQNQLWTVCMGCVPNKPSAVLWAVCRLIPSRVWAVRSVWAVCCLGCFAMRLFSCLIITVQVFNSQTTNQFYLHWGVIWGDAMQSMECKDIRM